MKKMIQAVKGARDFYPEQMLVRNWLHSLLQRVSESFGYQEYDGPFLEALDLYAAKSGDELVKEQSFAFQDRNGDWITLRPELTPSLARMIAQKQRQLAFPVRWWSFGPMWRYERPQKGRSREFFQWNIDLIGAESVYADAEMIAIAATFLKEAGLQPSQVQVQVNNRRLIETQLDNLGIPHTNRPAVLRFIDRRDKLAPVQWQAYGIETVGLSASQVEGIKDMMGDPHLWQSSAELRGLFAALEAMGVASYVRYAPEIVRGLDYYTGTVFEVGDVDGEFRAILGGGRYDNLVADVGGEPLSGIGFAMGDVVISLVLEKYQRIPPTARLAPPLTLVTVFDETTMLASMQLAHELRQHGLNAASYPQVTRLDKQLKYADRVAAAAVVILGPEELQSGALTIKDLSARGQQTISRADAPQAIRGILARNAAS
jgi:histidyl-tRNA synthetase